jgi:hypothetical protein
MQNIIPFPERKLRLDMDSSLEESCLCYMQENGCFKRIVAVLVESSFCFDCGETYSESETIHLGGYEVQARGHSITPMGDKFPVDLYFHTENLAEANQGIDLFTAGNVLLVESNAWSVIDKDFTLYINSLVDIASISGEIGQAITAMIMGDSHES